jgi:hypothetical protein
MANNTVFDSAVAHTVLFRNIFPLQNGKNLKMANNKTANNKMLKVGFGLSAISNNTSVLKG